MEHHLADASSTLAFLLRWSDISRCGAATVAAAPPFLDCRILAPRNPPRRQFNHIEHQTPPSLETPVKHSETTACTTFSLTRGQINSLKQTCRSKNTTYEVVAGHAWRCVTAARLLPENQETMLQIAIEGRQRLRPPLPAGYSGNVNFYAAAVVSCGELKLNPFGFAVGKVHEAIARMDDEYMRSAVDNWELLLSGHGRGGTSIPLVEDQRKCPNLGITSWIWLPSYGADLRRTRCAGWGKPIYAGPGAAASEGRSYLFADPDNEGGLLLAITLHKQHMENLDNLLYDDNSCSLLSKI